METKQQDTVGTCNVIPVFLMHFNITSSHEQEHLKQCESHEHPYELIRVM